MRAPRRLPRPRSWPPTCSAEQGDSVLRKPFLTSAALLLACSALAGDKDIQGVTLGRLVMGPVVTLEQCKGNVVLLEFWGVR